MDESRKALRGSARRAAHCFGTLVPQTLRPRSPLTMGHEDWLVIDNRIRAQQSLGPSSRRFFFSKNGSPLDRGRRGPRWDPLVEGEFSLQACGARPSAGWAIQGKMALRGKPWDNAKGVFLGGTRSARPQIGAGPKPGHVIATHGSARGRWPKGGQYWVWRNAFLPGVRSPPLVSYA